MATANPVYNPNTSLSVASVGTGLSLSGGVLSNPSVAATYLVQTASSDLSAEQAMGSLSTGLVKNTTTTGVQSIATAGTDYTTDVAHAFYRAQAFSRIGVTAGDTTFGTFWDDFTVSASASVIPSWFRSNAGSGATTTQVAGSGAGLVQFSSGATANSREDWHTLVGCISVVTTAKWYIAARLKVTTTPDAQAFVGFGLTNIAFNKSIIAGAWGAGSTVNFGVQYDGNFAGTNLSLATALDTSFHIFELYGTGSTTLRARIDGGSEVTATMSGAPSDAMYPLFITRNGTTAAAQTQIADWAIGVYARI